MGIKSRQAERQRFRRALLDGSIDTRSLAHPLNRAQREEMERLRLEQVAERERRKDEPIPF